MSNWYVKDLGDGLMAWEPLQAIETQFAEYYHQGADADVGVFVRHESEGSLHCRVKVYLSPAAEGFANKVGALPCMEPSLIGLSLLAGSDSALAKVHEVE